MSASTHYFPPLIPTTETKGREKKTQMEQKGKQSLFASFQMTYHLP